MILVESLTYNVETEKTVRRLIESTSHYWKPQLVIIDRGTAFTATLFEDFCTTCNVTHTKVATATPRANGQAERINSVIISALGCDTKEIDCDEWDITLMEVQCGL